MERSTIEKLSPLLENILRLFLKHVRDQFLKHNLTWGETRLLVLIDQIEGISQVELARELGIKPISILRRVDKLEKLGLVERVKYKADRRVNQLYLTDKGREAHEFILELGVKLISSALPKIEQQELKQIFHSLQKLEKGLSNL